MSPGNLSGSVSKALFTLIVCTLLVSLLSLSCAVRPSIPVAPREGRCPEKAIARLRENAASMHTLKATLDMNLSIEEPKYAGKLQVGLLRKRPDKTRLNVYAGFAALFSIGIEGDSVYLFLPAHSILFSGTMGDYVLPSIGQVMVKAIDSSLYPYDFCSGECQVSLEDGRTCRIEEKIDGGTRVAYVDARKGRLKEIMLLDGDNRERLSVTYRDYKSLGGLSFPHRIAISLPYEGVKASLSFRRVELNRSLDDSLFRLGDVSPGSTKQLGGPPDIKHLLR